MRKLLTSFLFVALMLSAAAAHAGWVIEGSVGKGYRVDEPRGWEPTNVMVAPGYQLLGILRLQLGLVGDLGDVENRKFDLELRPMIGIYPPILPLYARAIFAVQNLLHDHKQVAVGGAAGIKIGLPFIGLGFFVEGGVLPRFDPGATVVEGRAGAFWAF